MIFNIDYNLLTDHDNTSCYYNNYFLASQVVDLILSVIVIKKYIKYLMLKGAVDGDGVHVNSPVILSNAASAGTPDIIKGKEVPSPLTAENLTLTE